MAKRILVADNEQTLLSLYGHVLAEEGYEVLLAATAPEALRKVRDDNPDLVVLDLKMPGMDGIEALYKIIDIRRDLPVVINTGHPDFEGNYLSWAADAFVRKSSDLTELKGTIQRLLS
jgi:CheY-like chemotaxis protein